MCFRIILLLKVYCYYCNVYVTDNIYICFYMNFLDMFIRCDVGISYVMNNDVMFYLLCVYLTVVNEVLLVTICVVTMHSL